MGKKSLLLTLATVLGTFIPLSSIAQDDLFNQPELTGMFTISIPLDDPRPRWKREGTQLGFNMGVARPVAATDYGYQPAQTQFYRPALGNALVDIKFDFDKNNWDTFKIGGLDNLQYDTVVYADGTEADEPSGFKEFEELSLGTRVAILGVGMIAVFSAADN